MCHSLFHDTGEEKKIPPGGWKTPQLAIFRCHPDPVSVPRRFARLENPKTSNNNPNKKPEEERSALFRWVTSSRNFFHCFLLHFAVVVIFRSNKGLRLRDECECVCFMAANLSTPVLVTTLRPAWIQRCLPYRITDGAPPLVAAAIFDGSSWPGRKWESIFITW